MTEGLKERPRLRAAYRAYQDLMNRMDVDWRPGLISDWIGSLEEYLSDETEKEELEGRKPLNEFDALMQVIETFEKRIDAYLASGLRIPENYRLTVGRMIAAVKVLPFCTYDILRAHMLMGAAPALVSEGGVQYRKGVRAEAVAEELERAGEQARQKRGTEPTD